MFESSFIVPSVTLLSCLSRRLIGLVIRVSIWILRREGRDPNHASDGSLLEGHEGGQRGKEPWHEQANERRDMDRDGLHLSPSALFLPLGIPRTPRGTTTIRNDQMDRTPTRQYRPGVASQVPRKSLFLLIRILT